MQYPKMLYRNGLDDWRIVDSAEEEAAALDGGQYRRFSKDMADPGWKPEPLKAPVLEPVVEPVAEDKPKRGRPRGNS
jgi:hypothetical protein